MIEQEYISNLHADFKRMVSGYLSMVETFLLRPQVTDADKQVLEQYKIMLKGKDVHEIEECFSEGDIIKALDKIAKFYKDLSDYALEHINENLIWKQVVRQLIFHHIESGKEFAKERYNEVASK